MKGLFRERLLTLLEEHGVALKALAAECGKHPSQLSREINCEQPDAWEAFRLGRGLERVKMRLVRG